MLPSSRGSRPSCLVAGASLLFSRTPARITTCKCVERSRSACLHQAYEKNTGGKRGGGSSHTFCLCAVCRRCRVIRETLVAHRILLLLEHHTSLWRGRDVIYPHLVMAPQLPLQSSPTHPTPFLHSMETHSITVSPKSDMFRHSWPQSVVGNLVSRSFIGWSRMKTGAQRSVLRSTNLVL